MPAKRHHYIPQFYLRGFLKHNRKQLTVLNINNGDFFQTDTKNVGIETDWNRVCDDRTSIEEHFATIDGATSQVLKKITVDETLPTDIDDICLLYYFMARLSVHNPFIRKQLTEVETKGFKQFARWNTSSSGIYYEQVKDENVDELVPYEYMKRFVEEGKYKISFDHGYFLEWESKFIVEDLIPLFLQLKWSLLIADELAGRFVCSDWPVFMNTTFNQIPGETDLIPGLTFSLPLNRRMCLYADSLGFLPINHYIYKEDVLDNPSLSVPHLNSRTIYMARRHIYAGNLKWEIATATGGKRDANSLIGKKIKDVIDAWFNAYHFKDNSLRNLALDTVRSYES